jgi:hypothetical protein
VRNKVPLYIPIEPIPPKAPEVVVYAMTSDEAALWRDLCEGEDTDQYKAKDWCNWALIGFRGSDWALFRQYLELNTVYQNRLLENFRSLKKQLEDRE